MTEFQEFLKTGKHAEPKEGTDLNGECWCCEYGKPYYVFDEQQNIVNKNTRLTICKIGKFRAGVVATIRNKGCSCWKHKQCSDKNN